MYLIVGLGNPESEYSYTRHNMGFDVINKLSEKYNIDLSRNGFQSIYGSGIIEGEKVILCKPQTYMNLSGDAISEIVNFYKIPADKIVIIYDDIDIESGAIKLRRKGGAGGHNGMKSVLYRLQTEDFSRVRVGTGMYTGEENLIDYVLRKISGEEYKKLLDGINKATEAVVDIIKIGIDNAMNRYN